MFALLLSLVLFSTTQAFPGRIVNGTDAEPGEFPYIVSLQYSERHYCGATILNNYWVLTAAHCTDRWSQTAFRIQYGVTNISSVDLNTIPVEKLIVHDSYNAGSGYQYDIAVLKLAEPLEYSEFVQPVTLPPAFNATPEGATAVLAGWGSEYDGGNLAQNLKRVDLQVYTDDACEYIHSSTGPTNRLYHVCAGIAEGGKGQCSGDSGGPLLVNGIQVGIVSWSIKPCASAPYPGVFAKVSTSIEWIYETIAEENGRQGRF